MRMLSTCALLIGVSACGGEPELILPEGDIATGRALFVELRCNDCHSMSGIPHSGVDVAFEYAGKTTSGKVDVMLGGQTPKLRTQAELVASVINPSHRISNNYERRRATTKSPMRNYNDVMTVQNLVDIVSFLQDAYQVTPPRSIYKDPREIVLPYERKPEGESP